MACVTGQVESPKCATVPAASGASATRTLSRGSSCKTVSAMEKISLSSRRRTGSPEARIQPGELSRIRRADLSSENSEEDTPNESRVRSEEHTSELQSLRHL